MDRISCSAKGQVVSIDVLLALVIFAAAMAGVLHTENTLSASIRDTEEFRRTQDRLISLSDQLVFTRGDPDGWYNSSRIKSIGLMYSDHVLSDDKLVALTRFSSTALRGNLSTGANNVYVQLLNSGGGNCTVRSTNITAGTVPSGVRERTSIDRYVLTEDARNCTLRVTLWRA
ncbi:MAG: hypothetical protein HY366_01015 [Candidatus Aenigmarchaeota archaeon]|nr:hypothetical protein [Candidatus Aenigmarchaeota archaeon]